MQKMLKVDINRSKDVEEDQISLPIFKKVMCIEYVDTLMENNIIDAATKKNAPVD